MTRPDISLDVTHSLTKLSHLKKPEVAPDEYAHGPVPDDKQYFGSFIDAPQVGKSFIFWIPEIGNTLLLSTVQALYSPSRVQEGADKLVLPTGFPEPEHLSIPELLHSDVLIATRNSLYLLREVAQ
jgi:hypothetical protein